MGNNGNILNIYTFYLIYFILYICWMECREESMKPIKPQHYSWTGLKFCIKDFQNSTVNPILTAPQDQKTTGECEWRNVLQAPAERHWRLRVALQDKTTLFQRGRWFKAAFQLHVCQAGETFWIQRFSHNTTRCRICWGTLWETRSH